MVPPLTWEARDQPTGPSLADASLAEVAGSLQRLETGCEQLERRRGQGLRLSALELGQAEFRQRGGELDRAAVASGGPGARRPYPTTSRVPSAATRTTRAAPPARLKPSA
jgi:hypothetical protein